MFNEVEGNCKTPDQETQKYRLNHTMIRIKDPVKSVELYTRIMGMKLLRKIDFPAAKFSLYFLGTFDETEVRDIPDTDDERRAWVLSQKSILELTHNYGTEDDENFSYHDGNKDPRGFGHIAFRVPDVLKACDRFEKLGVIFQKNHLRDA